MQGTYSQEVITTRMNMENTKEVKQMNEERMKAALELLQFKAVQLLAAEREYIAIEELNEVFIVAGFGLIKPEKDLEVI